MPLDLRPAMQAAAKPAPADDLQQQLIKACRAGWAQKVQTSLAAGASVSAADGRGWTAMHHAAFAGYLQIVDQLLAAGCAAEVASLQGDTPLSLAALGRREAVCLCLIQAGASTEAVVDPSDRAYLEQLQGPTLQLAIPIGTCQTPAPAAALRSSPILLTAGALDSSAAAANFSTGKLPAKVVAKLSKETPSAVKSSGRMSVQSSKACMTEGCKSTRDEGSVASPRKQQVPCKQNQEAAAAGRMDTYKAWPMYVPAQYAVPGNNGSESDGSKEKGMPQSAGRTRWELHVICDKSGVSSGLLLDPNTQFVYYRPVICCSDTAGAQLSGLDDDGADKGSNSNQVPVLVGVQWQGGRIELPGVEHLQRLQQCPHAARSLKHNHPAARLLVDEARRATKTSSRKGVSLLADLCVELDAAPCCSSVSLAVPLCAVMGVQQVHELQQLRARQLRHIGVDEAFLQPLHCASKPINSVRDGTQQNSTKQNASDRCKAWLIQAAETAGKWQPPAVSQLLAQHGLLKLVPLAIEMGVLSSRKISSWGCLIRTALQKLQLWAPELARLQALKDDIKMLQEQCSMMQAGRLVKLSRIGVGSLVLYESGIDEAVLKGQRTIGIVLEAPGSHSTHVTLRSQYVVRDLLHYNQEVVTAGRVSLTSSRAAQQYLRADLLPPHTLGCPVTPFTAAPGLLVQLVSRWPASSSKSIAQAQVQQDAALCLPTVLGQLDAPVTNADAASSTVAAPDASGLEGPAMSAGSVHSTAATQLSDMWYVLWPDGARTQHAVGAAGRFELCHPHLHRLAGAPLLHHHLDDVQVGLQLPVLRSPLCPHTCNAAAHVPPGSIGLLHVGMAKSQPAGKQLAPGAAHESDEPHAAQEPGAPDAAHSIDNHSEPHAHVHNTGQGSPVHVMWSKARDPHTPWHAYAADEKGRYCLDHALLAGQPLTAMEAKPGVRVEATPAADKQVVAAAGVGCGTLLGPVRLSEAGAGVVWEVSWPGGTITMCTLPGWSQASQSPLCVAAIETQLPGEGSVPLNELQPSSTQATGGAAATVALNATVAVASSTLNRFTDTEKAARIADLGRIGRPLFTSHLSPRAGMLGAFVKLNREASVLQRYCAGGPLHAYTPRTPAEVLAAQQQCAPAAPLDDVGWVVKDTGAGQWRALLVRKLGSSHSFWYDEASLLPASQLDIIRQMKRMAALGCAYLPPIKDQGVPVTSITAAAGMLVMRAFTAAEVHEGTDKADMVGQLMQPVGEHHWQVSWQDGTTGVYKTGANSRFQLSHVNVAEEAGAPLTAATLARLLADADGLCAALNIMPGQHSCRPALQPGTASQSDIMGQQPLKPDISCLKWGQVAALAVKDAVVEANTGLIRVSSAAAAVPCTYVGGGPLGLFELAHAACAGEPVTMYIAKPGLRVMRAADVDDSGVELHASSTTQMASNEQVGILLRPVRLQLLAKLDSREPSGDPTQLLDAGLCWWDVQWGGEDGVVQQVPIGTLAEHTPLKVALGGPVRSVTAVTRAVAQLQRVLKALKQTSCKLLYGGNNAEEPTLISRLMTIAALVQVDCMRAGQGDAMDDLNEIDDAADVQSYEYTDYLQRVQQTVKAVGQLHSATLTLELSQQQLGGMQGTAASGALEAMSEIASDAADYISSSLPLACSIIHNATLSLTFDSCSFVLHDKGSVVKAASKVDLGLERDPSEVLRDCTDKVSKTSVSLNICCSKLQELEGMIPAEAFYSEALHERVQQEHSMAALACAGAAAEWLACAAIPIQQLVTDENTGLEELIVYGELVTACLAEQQRAIAAWQNAMQLVKPGTGCELRAAAERADEYSQPQQDAQWVMDDDSAKSSTKQSNDGSKQGEQAGDTADSELRAGEMCIGHVRVAVANSMQHTVGLLHKANMKLMHPPPAAARATTPPATMAPVAATATAAGVVSLQQGVPAATEQHVPATVAPDTVAAPSYATVTIHASDATQPPPLSDVDALKQALEVERGTKLMSDHAAILLQLLPACMPHDEAQDTAVDQLQQIQANASKAMQRVQQLAVQQASRAVREGTPAATPASMLCAALSQLAEAAGSSQVAEYWARRAASHWPDVLAGVRAAQREVAKDAGLHAAAAVRLAREAVPPSADATGQATDTVPPNRVKEAAQAALQAAEAASAKANAAAMAGQARDSWHAAVAAAESAVSAAARSADIAADARQHLSKVKVEASKAESAVEMLMDWQAVQALACTKGIVEGWASKMLDDIADIQELSEQDAMNWYQAGLQARQGPASSYASALACTAMHGTDKTLVALIAQLEPLRMSLQPLAACAPKDRLGDGGLDDSYNNVFQMAIQAVVNRHTDFERDIHGFKSKIEDHAQGRPSGSEDDDAPAKPLSAPAELVARAHGYVHALKATCDCAEALLKQVPMVLPKEDGVMSNLRECKKTKMPDLLKQVRDLDDMLLPDDRKALGNLSAVLLTPTRGAAQSGSMFQLLADDPRLAAAGLHAIKLEVVQQEDQEACFRLQAVARTSSQKAACELVNTYLSEDYAEQLEGCSTYAKQLQAATAKVQAVTGTSWSPTTLKLSSTVAALEQEWQQQVSAAVAQLPQLLVQAQAAAQPSHGSDEEDD